MFYRKTAYGITDKLVDFYVPIAILCAISVSIAMVVLKAEGMVYRIHCRPLFAAWVGPFAILLPVYFVEVLTYGILHPKKSYKNILIGILFYFLLYGLWVYYFFGIVRFCAARFCNARPKHMGVCICFRKSERHRYHYSEHCKVFKTDNLRYRNVVGG